MPRLRTMLALSVLLLVLSIAATALLSSVQRLRGGVTLDPGPHGAGAVPQAPRWALVHRASRPVAPPTATDGAIGVVQAAEPRVVHAPAPHYPIEALREQRQGLVRLRVELDGEGRVTGATVQQSSGDGELDKAALAAVRQWTFAMPPGARRDTVVPIRFHIDAARP